MPLISSINYPARRIAFGIDSVGLTEIDPIDIYKEYRARRQLNTDGGQNFDPLISAFGNQSVGGGERTAEYTNLATGVKIVPFDAEQIITITGFLVSTADELQGRELFDRSTILANVDIDYFPPATKIVEVSVSSGSGLSPAQSTQLADLHGRLTVQRATNLDNLDAQVSSCLNPILALVDGKQAINYTTATFTQKATDGSDRTIFDLFQEDGTTPATGPDNALVRIPRA
ncbi:MAG: hypothetical protein AAGD09_03275 [Cyanobacteria bacterium P01_F01_bin.56]